MAASIPPPGLPTAPSLALRMPDGRRGQLLRPGVVLFWRSDCAPCRLELSDRSALRRAAAPMRLQWVNLDDPSRPPTVAAPATPRAEAPAAEVLTAWGGTPPRLPLAVAVNAQGQVCARHAGLIGLDRLRTWAKACGGVLARR